MLGPLYVHIGPIGVVIHLERVWDVQAEGMP